jgi:hypothetical protein
MKSVIVLLTAVIFLSCKSENSDSKKIFMAGALMEKLRHNAAYSDSLKVEVFLVDEKAANYLVEIPGGGYAFSKQYKMKIADNKELSALVEKCNVSVLAYGTLKTYIAKELIAKIPGKSGDSLKHIFSTLR